MRGKFLKKQLVNECFHEIFALWHFLDYRALRLSGARFAVNLCRELAGKMHLAKLNTLPRFTMF